MRALTSIPNTNPPSSDFPAGRIHNKDNTAIPPIIGTPVIEELYGDIVIFFQRIAQLGGITMNNLADNWSIGFQTVTALWAAILGQFAASDGATRTGTATNLFVTPAGLTAKDGGLIKEIFEITSWSMPGVVQITIPHGIVNGRTKILNGVASIRPNSTSSLEVMRLDSASPADGLVQGIVRWDDTNVYLSTTPTANNLFLQSDYGGTSDIRGNLMIEYLP